MFYTVILPDGWWFMPAEPVPADPGRDGDPAWPDQDPMTAAEREAWLDHLAESGEPPGEEDEDFEPLTAAELAEVRAAAADDEMLAAEAAGSGDGRVPKGSGPARLAMTRLCPVPIPTRLRPTCGLTAHGRVSRTISGGMPWRRTVYGQYRAPGSRSPSLLCQALFDEGEGQLFQVAPGGLGDVT
jgi:hypothetical protein